MAREAAEAEARRFGRAAGLLSVGVGAAGLLTYVYFSLASHNLDKVDYGEVVVLWSAVFVTISILFRPVEQLLSRTIAERQAQRAADRAAAAGRGDDPARRRRRLRASAPSPCGSPSRTSCCPATRPCTGSWSPPCSPSARASSRAAFWPAAGASPSTPLLLLAESTARVSFALAVAVGIASGQTAVALGIVAAPLLSLTVVPLAFAAARGPEPRRPPPERRRRRPRASPSSRSPRAAASRPPCC